MTIIIILLSVIVLLSCSILLNNLIKKTNWYKNIFIYTTDFPSLGSNSSNLRNNYDIINLGSNPARFAFLYEGINGQNWSTGTQGLLQDLEILKHHFSFIKKRGIILIPITPFTSISPYLKYKPEYLPLSYHAKFVKILGSRYIRELSLPMVTSRFIKTPLLIYPKSLFHLIRDSARDDRLLLTDQLMKPNELEKDAENWIRGWKREFDIEDLTKPLSNLHNECFIEATIRLRNIIDFCIDNELKPVIILPPVTSFLHSYFSSTVKETFIYSFVKQANINNILFLDYFNDNRFQDSSLYFNSFFLNLTGRRLFTKQVIQDLRLTYAGDK
jgi:hypothetical protein